MERRNVQKLNSPSDFMTTSAVTCASSTLLTPSHFTATATCPFQSPSPHGTDAWTLLAHTTHLTERRAEEQSAGAEGRVQRETLPYKQMQKMSENHMAVSPLTPYSSKLQYTLHTLTQEMTSLRHQMDEITLERDSLKEQLRVQSYEKAEQAETLNKLRDYIGTHTGGAEQNTLLEKVQKEKETLGLSVELLNVQVKAVHDILILQERELEEQCDPLHKDRLCGLLSLWREKVFRLLVQLRSKDSQLHTENTQLHHMVSSLKQEIQKLQSHIITLQHNLQDNSAQLQLNKIQTQELQQQLCSAVEENERLKKHKGSSEKSTAHVADTVRRMSVCVREWECQTEAIQCRMSSLTQRLNFANIHLHTVHGLLMRREALWKVQQATKPVESTASNSRIEKLQSQVALLISERENLTQELKRTPQLITNALRDLQVQLDRKIEELAVCEIQCVDAHKFCEEQERTIIEMHTEAYHKQTVLQEKLSEMEKVCTTHLTEIESQLNTTRKEHTKAVGALRQLEQAAEQERKAESVRLEQTHNQITQLHTQLKEKDKDCNILLAVVQQQGLMSEYKKMRRAAIHVSTAVMDKKQHKQHHSGDIRHQEGSVLRVLCELRSLSSALVHSTDEEDEEDGKGHGDHTYSTHTSS